MLLSEDEIQTFIPDAAPNLLILGTMASACARTKDGRRPKDVFYYQDSRNQFWKILQVVFENAEPRNLMLSEKIDFLNKHRIALSNIVSKIEIPESEKHISADKVLFQAEANGRLEYKKVSADLLKILSSTPLFFSCRPSSKILHLVGEFLKSNKIDTSLKNKMHFLHSPTRRSVNYISKLWTQEIERHMKDFR